MRDSQFIYYLSALYPKGNQVTKGSLLIARRFSSFSLLTSLILALMLAGSTKLYAEAGEPISSKGISAEQQTLLMQNMIRVKGGSFAMGSDSDDAQAAEKPAHTVSLDGFFIGRTEVTQGLFKAVMGWNNSYFQCEDCPVNNISWMNIMVFIQRLKDATGEPFRLPTEAEWAYAARGGQRSEGYQYSGSDDIDEVAWYAGNAEQRSHPVARKKPNELGLYDMTGNLWEFCMDDMSTRAYTREARVNPNIIHNDNHQRVSMKVTRGGGYEFSANENLLYRRDGATSNVRMPDIGFRLAMSTNVGD
jgi:formylglycine-generating enzyme required for sulfatase activity